MDPVMTEAPSLAKEMSDKLLKAALGKGKILIVTHDNPDPDSLASAFCLKHLFLIRNGVEATVAFGGVIGRGENRAMVRELEIKAVPLDGLDVTQFGLVCMVDTQPGTGNNSYPEGAPVHLVIDHHPLRRKTAECRFYDVRPDYGASATILYEYLMAQKVDIHTKMATILFYAIKSETQDLGREWCRADREAYLDLLPLSNNRILFRITRPEVPREYFLSYSKAITNARLYECTLVFNLYEIHNPDIVAEMADFLLRMEGVDMVLGMGCYEHKEVLSLRTSRPEIRAGCFMRELLGGLGTAGGHGLTAGGQIVPMPGDRSGQKQLEATLTRKLLLARGQQIQPGSMLSPAPACRD